MAQPEYRYHPLDFEPDVAVGVLLPFNGNSPGRTFNQNYASGSSGGASVFTRKGERFMQPDFGTQIVDSLFEQSTEDLETSIEDGLNEDIATWLPYIIVDGINVERVIDQHMLNISLEFRITENGANQVIKILLDENGVEINNSIL